MFLDTNHLYYTPSLHLVITHPSLELMLTPALMALKKAQQQQTAILRQCATWIDEGKLTIHLSQTFPLEQVKEAHPALETGSITGKIALIID